MEEMGDRSGLGLAELLLSRLGDTSLEDVYIDEDEDGRFIGIVFSDGDTEYHLTVDENGVIELDQGPLEGESLETVVSFALGELEPPFSSDSSTSG